MNYKPSSFENPDRKLWIREAAGGISRVFLALFVFSLVSFALVNAVGLALALFAPSLYLSLAEDPVFSIALSSVSMYLIAFPLFWLIVRKMRVHKPERKKLKAGWLVLAFCVAEALTLVGSMVSAALTGLIETVSGITTENSTSELVSRTPMWLIILVVVIIGPIVEELIFRKLMLDRLSVHGETFALIITSVAFGIFHNNIYQLFYATLLGILLGYLYLKSGDIKLPIILHMLMNLFGSVVALFVEGKLTVIEELASQYGDALPMTAFPEAFDALCAELTYVLTLYGTAIAGFVILIIAFSKKQVRLSRDCPLPLDGSGLAEATLINVGVILFLVLSALITLLNTVAPMLS